MRKQVKARDALPDQLHHFDSIRCTTTLSILYAPANSATSQELSMRHLHHMGTSPSVLFFAVSVLPSTSASVLFSQVNNHVMLTTW